MAIKIIAQNKKAHFNYEFLNTFEAGISLTGPEIKSIRNGDVSINEAFVIIRKGEAFVINMNIKKYDYANYVGDQDPTRQRKLLLHKNEILRMEHKVKLEKLTIVPIKLYWSNDKVKMEIGLGRGKKLHDKRETIKARDSERNIKKYVK